PPPGAARRVRHPPDQRAPRMGPRDGSPAGEEKIAREQPPAGHRGSGRHREDQCCPQRPSRSPTSGRATSEAQPRGLASTSKKSALGGALTIVAPHTAICRVITGDQSTTVSMSKMYVFGFTGRPLTS